MNFWFIDNFGLFFENRMVWLYSLFKMYGIYLKLLRDKMLRRFCEIYKPDSVKSWRFWWLFILHLRYRRHLATYPNNLVWSCTIFLFGLAPSGVYTAMPVTSHAVSSYLAFSTLPVSRRYIFRYTFPNANDIHLHRRVLPGTLLQGVRTFLYLISSNHPISQKH